MRNAFIAELCELAEVDERVFLVCGDLGYSVLEQFAKRFPERFLNAGVAEQNMTGVAAGLAMAGKRVFTYSIANFPVMRCLEQIRNDICYHDLDVTVVSIGAGLAYGSSGYSHHAVEDLAVMRALPNMTVLAPGDPVEARLATRALVTGNGGPAYLRLGKAGETVVHQSEPSFEIGKALEVRTGSDVTLIATGGVLPLVVEAADALDGDGLSAAVLSMPTLEPLDRRAVMNALATTQAVVTIEEHGPGGLGSAVAEVVAEAATTIPFAPVRLRREALHRSGTQASMRAVHGLTVSGVCSVAVGLLERQTPTPQREFVPVTS